MPLLGVGIDILKIDRIHSLIQRRGIDRLASRILSAEELTIFHKSPPSSHTRFLAVRFAVKEAAYKALYPSFRPMWKELSFYSSKAVFNEGKPALLYKPAMYTTATSREPKSLHASISHEDNYVVALVVAETSN